MTYRLAALIAASLFCVSAGRPPMRYQPDPSSVFAAEIAMARLSREKGQWAAFRETAAEDAVMFVPQRVAARQWLKGRSDRPAPLSWTPSVVYVSCDGNLAASTGGWKRADGTVGYFVTIWRRDKRGVWQWVLDHRPALGTPRAEPEQLTGKVATCKRPDATPGASAANRPPAPPEDASLTWSADVAADGAPHITVRAWNGVGYDVVIDEKPSTPRS